MDIDLKICSELEKILDDFLKKNNLNRGQTFTVVLIVLLFQVRSGTLAGITPPEAICYVANELWKDLIKTGIVTE